MQHYIFITKIVIRKLKHDPHYTYSYYSKGKLILKIEVNTMEERILSAFDIYIKCFEMIKFQNFANERFENVFIDNKVVITVYH